MSLLHVTILCNVLSKFEVHETYLEVHGKTDYPKQKAVVNQLKKERERKKQL